MRRRTTTVIAALVLAFLGVPAEAKSAQPAYATTVETLNRDGFAEFASYGEDYSTVMVSPAMSWYVHRFLGVRAHDARAAAMVERLRADGVSISATVHAARGRTSYTDRTAAVERADLGIATQWDQPEKPGDFAWSFTAAMGFRDELGDGRAADSPESYLQAPFYARDGIRAVRLDARSGSRTLFVFWATKAVLTDVRRRMSPQTWASMSTGFTQSELNVSQLFLHLRNGVPVGIRADEGFGSYAIAYGPHPAPAVSIAMDVSLGAVGGRIEATAQGYPSVYAPGEPQPAYTTEIVTWHRIPPENVVSATVPMMYVVEDARSGAILVLGENG
ncbi:MAG TPA: hypothetical protein VGC96_12435 [Candidatus Elarobacter sp.]